MATKKPSLFEMSGSEPRKEKLPTLRQYVKALPKETNESDFISPVVKIWFPGNWDNFSIETRKFRCSIAGNHPLYEPLDRTVGTFRDRETGILLRIDDREELSIRFIESGEYGVWRPIGDAGVVFEPTPN